MAQTRHTIVAPNAVIGDSVRHVAGDRGQVESLMGEGVDPHLYRLTRSDVARLTRMSGWIQAFWTVTAELARETLAAVDSAVLATLPREVVALPVVTLAIVLAIALFFKELEIVSFDPDLATSLGIPARSVSIGLIALVAVAAVAAFDAVGSVLVIAMFICPASTARVLIDRLSRQLWISTLVAMLSGVAGYFLAAFGPFWGSAADSLNAAGMIVVVAGGLQMLAMLFAPRYGFLPRMLRHRRMREAA